MFDFQKEVIINSNVIADEFMADGTPQPKFGSITNAVDANKSIFRVFRCADYYAGNLLDGVVYKTAPVAGVMATATFTLPDNSVPGVYRIIIGLSLGEKYLSDYAYPWFWIAKPVIAEFEVVAGMTQVQIGAAALAAVKACVPADYQFIKVAVNGAGTQLTVTGTDSHQIIRLAKIQSTSPDDCACEDYIYTDVSNAVITPNRIEWGTGKWIEENLRFPTYANRRYEALNAEEQPVIGGQYYQYSFQYASPRRGLHGQGTTGQALTSITTHTFYVLAAHQTAFEAAMVAGLTSADGAPTIQVVAPDSTTTVVANTVPAQTAVPSTIVNNPPVPVNP